MRVRRHWLTGPKVGWGVCWWVCGWGVRKPLARALPQRFHLMPCLTHAAATLLSRSKAGGILQWTGSPRRSLACAPTLVQPARWRPDSCPHAATLQAGTLDTLIDRLPGWPDNINRSPDGNFWLALVLPDVPLVTPLLPLACALPEPCLRRTCAGMAVTAVMAATVAAWVGAWWTARRVRNMACCAPPRLEPPSLPSRRTRSCPTHGCAGCMPACRSGSCPRSRSGAAWSRCVHGARLQHLLCLAAAAPSLEHWPCAVLVKCSLQ